jgi:hypothetical protein
MSPRPGPRHLAGPRTSARATRNRAAAVTLGILLLLVLAVTISRAVSALGSRSRERPPAAAAPTTGPPASPPTRAAPGSATPTTTTPPENLVGNSGFETGVHGWRPIGGGRIDLVQIAHEGNSGIRLTGGSARDPGVAYPAVTTTRAKGSMYVASAWVRPSQPGQTGEIRLLEYVGGQRFATFRSGLRLDDSGWHRLQVAQLVHAKGSTLAVEVVAPRLSRHASLAIDDVTVRLENTK